MPFIFSINVRNPTNWAILGLLSLERSFRVCKIEIIVITYFKTFKLTYISSDAHT